MLILHGFIKESGAWYNFTKEVAEGLKISDKKMYLDAINEIIKENANAFVNLLKESDCYSIVAKNGGVTKIAGDEDTDTEDSVEDSYGNDED